MAQAMTVCGFCGAANPLKRQPSLLSQIQKIKPTYSQSHLFFSPLPSVSPPSSSSLRTFALFKSKAKAPPKKVVEKPKKKFEDGIFGTSGGIGFTKQNELFVGRVAMIGFANKQNANDQNEESPNEATPALAAQPIVAILLALSVLLCSGAQALEDGVTRSGGGALFRQACIGCHVGGGNVIQPGATLFAGDLERNGVSTEDDIYKVTYAGKGRMPGFGEQCAPRGQCTFGPRLKDEEIRLIAQFVKLQAQQGWPNID